MLFHVTYSRTCTLSSKATYGERGVGPARREDCCPRVKASLYPEVYPGTVRQRIHAGFHHEP